MRAAGVVFIAMLLSGAAHARDLMICEGPSDRAVQRPRSVLICETSSGAQVEIKGGLAQLYAEGWRLISVVAYQDRVRAYVEHD